MATVLASESFNPARGRFLHVITDDKFVDAALAIFEEVDPGAHDVLLIGPAGPIRHLKTFAPQLLHLDAALQRRFLSVLPRYSGVFIHYLTNSARMFVARAPRATRFIWLGWGADYYHLISPGDELLLPRTRRWVSQCAAGAEVSPAPNPLQVAAGLAHAASRPLAAARRFFLRRTARLVAAHAPGEPALLNRFDGVAMPILEDFEAVRKRHAWWRIPFVDWNYWTEGFDARSAPAAPTGNNVLLGNSATVANNHIEALEYLAAVLPPDRKVICPLSYGIPTYADAVEETGLRLLGDRFVAMRHYMDPAAYGEVLSSCSILFMNHLRQQAMGNIVLGLCAGARVFLHERSPLHDAMRRIGVRVYAHEELPDLLKGGEGNVPSDELQSTRAALERHYGRDSILRRTGAMLERLR